MSDHESAEQERRRRMFIAGMAVLLAVIAAAVAVPLALSGGSSSRTRSSTDGAAATPHTSSSTPTAPRKAKPRTIPAATSPGQAPPRATSPKPAALAVPAASGVAPTARGEQIPGRKNCPPSPAMTSDPEGSCAVAQAVFSEARRFYHQTGHLPAQVTVAGPGGTVNHLACVVLVPADEVTCTSVQYDAQFLLSAVGAKPPSGY